MQGRPTKFTLDEAKAAGEFRIHPRGSSLPIGCVIVVRPNGTDCEIRAPRREKLIDRAARWFRALTPLAFIAGLSVCSGCTGPKWKAPCKITGVELRLMKDTTDAGRYCREVLGSCPDDGCEGKDKNPSQGCARLDPPLIVLGRNGWQHFSEEVIHLFDHWCLMPGEKKFIPQIPDIGASDEAREGK